MNQLQRTGQIRPSYQKRLALSRTLHYSFTLLFKKKLGSLSTLRLRADGKSRKTFLQRCVAFSKTTEVDGAARPA